MSRWDDAPIVEVPLAVCPRCRSPRYVPIRGFVDADGGRTSRRVCRVCSLAYVVLTLLPDFGSGALDSDSMFPEED